MSSKCVKIDCFPDYHVNGICFETKFHDAVWTQRFVRALIWNVKPFFSSYHRAMRKKGALIIRNASHFERKRNVCMRFVFVTNGKERKRKKGERTALTRRHIFHSFRYNLHETSTFHYAARAPSHTLLKISLDRSSEVFFLYCQWIEATNRKNKKKREPNHTKYRINDDDEKQFFYVL